MTRSRDLVRSFDHAPWVSSLRGLSESLGAADDVEAVAEATAAWIRGILGPDAAIALARPDGSGRLRVVWSVGSFLLGQGSARRRMAERRIVLASLQPSRVGVADRRSTLAVFPLASRGVGVGVAEILGPERRIRKAWDVLEVGSTQIGVALDAISRSERLRQEVETLERASSLGAALVGARSPDDAVRCAIRFVWERFRVPVAGWCGPVGRAHRFVETRGIAGRRRRELASDMPTIPAWGSLDLTEREELKVRFQELAGVRRVSALDVGDAVLLVGRPPGGVDGSLEMVGSLLAEVLRVLDSAAIANLRDQRLDLGIAWTAHELRGPLLGIRAALELLLRRRSTDPSELRVLQTTLNELDQLAGSAEAILTWAVGGGPLDRDEADLVRLVDDVVESIALETGGEARVVVTAPERAMGRFDPTHVRTVIANLIRNALAYSFHGTKVDVIVQHVGDGLQLSVRDEGPEIPEDERRLVFDPFARGSSSSVRNGSGLGLYIARQVVKAHDGRIWVESEGGTTTFVVRLPIEGRGIRRFAS